jgi:urease subunit beta
MTNELLVLSEDGHGHKSTRKACDASHPMSYPDTKGYQPDTAVPVGGVVLSSIPIGYNMGRQVVKVRVHNTGDRPIQVGSHFHFFEVNRYLKFNRTAAYGTHLNIPATTAIRFEPGDEREVELVGFGGKCRIIGFNGLTSGYAGGEDTPTYFPTRIRAIARMMKYRFRNSDCGCGADGCYCDCDEKPDCNCNTDGCNCGTDGCNCDEKQGDGGKNCDCEPEGCKCETKKK